MTGANNYPKGTIWLRVFWPPHGWDCGLCSEIFPIEKVGGRIHHGCFIWGTFQRNIRKDKNDEVKAYSLLSVQPNKRCFRVEQFHRHEHWSSCHQYRTKRHRGQSRKHPVPKALQMCTNIDIATSFQKLKLRGWDGVARRTCRVLAIVVIHIQFSLSDCVRTRVIDERALVCFPRIKSWWLSINHWNRAVLGARKCGRWGQ